MRVDLREIKAQASVEAAFLLPFFLTVLLLMLQPVCLLYTRSVMESAAVSTARLMLTSEDTSDASCKAFALRQLSAVPDVSIFHAGGPLAWDIELARADAEGMVAVSITGAVTPLPVLGAFVGFAGTANAQGDIELNVDVNYDARPDWLEGNYEVWTSVWE